MPERAAPAEEGRPGVGGPVPPFADPDPGDEVVLHDEPVRIPLSALPATSRPSGGSRFATILVIGTAGAPWFAAALVTGDRTAVYFAAAWLAVLLVDLAFAFRHRS